MREEDVNEWAECVGAGWRPIVRWAIVELDRLGAKIFQVKEKFGGLRIYYCPEIGASAKVADAMSAIVADAENVCAKLCEFCGNLGQKRSLSGWVKTVCDSCHADMEAKR